MDFTSTTYTNARKHFKKYCDVACDDSIPVLIERKNDADVVLVSADEYSSLMETLYLTNSSRMKKRLDESMKSKKTVSFKNIDELRKRIGL